MRHFLQTQTSRITEYDEQLVRRLIEKITVYDDKLKLGQLIRALHISADPFFYPAAPTDNLDYQRLLVYLSECTNDQITTILALVEAYLRTYKTHETE